MSEWLAFRTEARGEAFTVALANFKAAVPSTSRRWDGEHRYWLFDPRFADTVADIESSLVEPAVSLTEDDRRHGRIAVRDDEQLDTALIDMQFRDAAARAEFERLLREAES